jgi:uncharacterized protein
MTGRSGSLRWLPWSKCLGLTLRSLLAAGVAVALLLMAVLPAPKPHPDLRHRPIASGDVAALPWSALAAPESQARARIEALRRRVDDVADSDMRARPVWREMQQWQGKAAGNAALHGQVIRIVGYVVPLQRSREGLRSLLLVPYFGACIHAPPPPADQVIHIVLDKPDSDLKLMSVVRAEGRLALERQDTEMAVSSYRLDGARLVVVEPEQAR